MHIPSQSAGKGSIETKAANTAFSRARYAINNKCWNGIEHSRWQCRAGQGLDGNEKKESTCSCYYDTRICELADSFVWGQELGPSWLIHCKLDILEVVGGDISISAYRSCTFLGKPASELATCSSQKQSEVYMQYIYRILYLPGHQDSTSSYTYPDAQQHTSGISICPPRSVFVDSHCLLSPDPGNRCARVAMWRFTCESLQGDVTDMLNGFVCQKGLVQITLPSAAHCQHCRFDAIHRSLDCSWPSKKLCKTQEELEYNQRVKNPFLSPCSPVDLHAILWTRYLERIGPWLHVWRLYSKPYIRYIILQNKKNNIAITITISDHLYNANTRTRSFRI